MIAERSGFDPYSLYNKLDRGKVRSGHGHGAASGKDAELHAWLHLSGAVGVFF